MPSSLFECILFESYPEQKLKSFRVKLPAHKGLNWAIDVACMHDFVELEEVKYSIQI
jgi:hypothetical protein